MSTQKPQHAENAQNVMILGGHGKVALLAAPKLVEAGHTVTSVIRNPDHVADVEVTGAKAVVQDIEQLDVAGFEKLFADQDVIIWSAGVGGGDDERTLRVDRDAAIRSIDGAGTKRFVMVSYFNSRADHGVPEDHSMFTYCEAKAAADDHLRASSTQWTIVGPSALTMDEPTAKIETRSPKADGTANGDDALQASQVSRADVASVIAEVVDHPNLVGHFIEFNKGDTPITEALDAHAENRSV